MKVMVPVGVPAAAELTVAVNAKPAEPELALRAVPVFAGAVTVWVRLTVCVWKLLSPE